MNRDDDQRDEALADLDARYYKLAGDLAPALLTFMRSNSSDVVLDSSSDIPAR